MANYTNTGLVAHVKMALGLKTIYMWGGILRLVEKQCNTLKDIYGNTAGTGYTDARWAKLAKLRGTNTYGVDCVGLIKSYLWSGKVNGGTGSPYYGKSGYPPDITANLMYQNAKEKGPIATLPEIPGILVYRKSIPHIGVYIGNGEVIESTLSGRGDGVIKTKLSNFNWEFWLKCPYITYTTEKIESKEIQVGDIVCIKTSATTYAGVNTKIPAAFKAANKRYTVDRVNGDRARLKELYSWVWLKDITKT